MVEGWKRRGKGKERNRNGKVKGVRYYIGVCVVVHSPGERIGILERKRGLDTTCSREVRIGPLP